MGLLNWIFERGDRLLVRGCEAASRLALSSQTFTTAGDAYLSRYYLIRKTKKTDPTQDDELTGWPVSVYLHYFHRGDIDDELHNHPWGISFSLVLTNGYIEERWTGRSITKRTLRPGSINILRSDDYHRVDLIDPRRGAWTLFIAGKRVQDWGFWHPAIRPEFVPWKKFVDERERDARRTNQN